MPAPTRPRTRVPRSARAATLILTELALASALTGCTDTRPTVMPTPEIVWQDGITPTSPLEGDPLVKVAREADIGLAMAFSSGDFTITQFTDNWDHDYVIYLSQFYASQGDDPFVDPGPDPWQPVRIVSHDEHAAVLEVCELLPGDGWFKTRTQPGGMVDRGDAGLRWYEFVRIDHRWVRTTGGEHNGEDFGPCDGSTVPVGYFRPVPELPKTPVTAPVRAPLPTPTDDEPVHR